jgi:hypothetical protein
MLETRKKKNVRKYPSKYFYELMNNALLEVVLLLTKFKDYTVNISFKPSNTHQTIQD